MLMQATEIKNNFKKMHVVVNHVIPCHVSYCVANQILKILHNVNLITLFPDSENRTKCQNFKNLRAGPNLKIIHNIEILKILQHVQIIEILQMSKL